jgi:hypothetical protein
VTGEREENAREEELGLNAKRKQERKRGEGSKL